MEYGFLSLLPPIVAVVMAIKSKNVILSLFCGGFVGTMIFAWGNPFAAVKSIIGDYFFVQLTDSYNAGVIVLVIFIGINGVPVPYFLYIRSFPQRLYNFCIKVPVFKAFQHKRQAD